MFKYIPESLDLNIKSISEPLKLTSYCLPQKPLRRKKGRVRAVEKGCDERRKRMAERWWWPAWPCTSQWGFCEGKRETTPPALVTTTMETVSYTTCFGNSKNGSSTKSKVDKCNQLQSRADIFTLALRFVAETRRTRSDPHPWGSTARRRRKRGQRARKTGCPWWFISIWKENREKKNWSVRQKSKKKTKEKK